MAAEGIYVRVDAVKAGIDFNLGKILEINFQPNTGETLNFYKSVE